MEFASGARAEGWGLVDALVRSRLGHFQAVTAEIVSVAPIFSRPVTGTHAAASFGLEWI